jgi:hypothetical protein
MVVSLLPSAQAESTIIREATMKTRIREPMFPAERIPRTPLGKKLLEIRRRIVASGRLLLTWENIEKEIIEQRGRRVREEEH